MSKFKIEVKWNAKWYLNRDIPDDVFSRMDVTYWSEEVELVERYRVDFFTLTEWLMQRESEVGEWDFIMKGESSPREMRILMEDMLKAAVEVDVKRRFKRASDKVFVELVYTPEESESDHGVA